VALLTALWTLVRRVPWWVWLGLAAAVAGFLAALWATGDLALAIGLAGAGGAFPAGVAAAKRPPAPPAPVVVVHEEARDQVAEDLADDRAEVDAAVEAEDVHPAEALAELGRRRRRR